MGEKGAAYTQTRIDCPCHCFITAKTKKKQKTRIGIHSKSASSLLVRSSSQNLLEDERKPGTGTKGKNRRKGLKQARGATALQASSLFPEASTPFPSISVLRSN